VAERETSIRRGIEALLTLAGDEAASEGGLGVTRVAQMLGREKTQVSRTLATMAEYGLVDRDPDTRAYRLGWRIYAMAQMAGSRHLLDAARPLLTDLVARFGEGAHLSVLQGGEVVTVLSEQSPHAVRAVNWIGRTTPAYCTSAGKALLLDHTPEELEALFEGRPLVAAGPATVRTVAELLAAIGDARDRGYAVADEEMDAGLTAAAAPVRDGHGRIVAAINVSGPTFRMRPRLADIGAAVASAAAEVSALPGQAAAGGASGGMPRSSGSSPSSRVRRSTNSSSSSRTASSSGGDS
jgi:IclR family KDG regulon transcriptional repressor